MLNELIDLSTPSFHPGLEYSLFQTTPIALDGPTTLQLALVGIATLAGYALITRRARRPLASQAGQRQSKSKKSPQRHVRRRKAA